MLCTRRCSICWCFKNLMQIFNKFCSTIARSRFAYAIRNFNCFFNFFAVFIELIWSTSTSFSFDLKISCAWLKASLFSSTCFFKSKLFSIFVTFLSWLCEDGSAEVSRLRAWLRVSRFRWNIVVNWATSCERNN